MLNEKFPQQGVSLSNIVTSGHRKDDTSHLVIKALESIDKILQVEVRLLISIVITGCNMLHIFFPKF